MIFTITEDHFSTEAEAFAEIESMGLHALALDVQFKDEDWHWHDFDNVAFVVSGSARVEFETEGVVSFSASMRVMTPAGTVHREFAGPSYRAVFGFNVKPTEFTRPINKPVIART